MSRVEEFLTELFASAPLSKVIEIALVDLEKIERNPKYVIQMSTWFEQFGHSGKGMCYVCFAGCVMASTLADCPIDDEDGVTLDFDLGETSRAEYGMTPARYKDERITKRLRALDLARRGYKEALPAFMDDKLDYVEIADSFDNYEYWTQYEDNPTKFKSNMKMLAGELRAKGY